eukprot:3351904-Prymnesium_polylepis.2
MSPGASRGGVQASGGGLCTARSARAGQPTPRGYIAKCRFYTLTPSVCASEASPVLRARVSFTVYRVCQLLTQRAVPTTHATSQPIRYSQGSAARAKSRRPGLE